MVMIQIVVQQSKKAQKDCKENCPDVGNSKTDTARGLLKRKVEEEEDLSIFPKS